MGSGGGELAKANSTPSRKTRLTRYTNIMSTKENDLWVEVAYQNFQQAVSEHDYALAKDIIADTEDRGFGELAKMMTEELHNTPVENFAVKSHSVWNL